jgi:hypothetical protein
MPSMSIFPESVAGTKFHFTSSFQQPSPIPPSHPIQRSYFNLGHSEQKTDTDRIKSFPAAGGNLSFG